MRIAHILKHSNRDNGSVHVAVDLACEQAKQGHDVTFISAKGEFAEQLHSAGVEVKEVDQTSSWVTALRVLIQLRRFIRARDTQVLHAHMMSSAIIGRLGVTGLNTRLVTTVHNSFDSHSWLMRLGDQIVAVSHAEERALLGRKFPVKKVRTVLNGVLGSQREGFTPPDEVVLHEPAIVTLSGLHPRKAIDDVIKAFDLLPQKDAWHLNIVGGGPQRQELERLVQDLRLEDHVHFLGSAHRPSDLLARAQIFILASLADPCPLAVMEARIAGCAVIGTHVGGVPELLDQGRAGVLVEPRSPEKLSKALHHLTASTAELEHWRRAAHSGSEYYSVARMAADYTGVYQRALSGIGRQHPMRTGRI